MGVAHPSDVRQRYRTLHGEAEHTLSFSTEWPVDLPCGLSLIRSLSDLANVSSLHTNHRVVLQIEDRRRPIGTSNRSQGYLPQPVLRIWRYLPQKRAIGKTKWRPPHLVSADEVLWKEPQLAVGNQPGAGLLVFHRPGTDPTCSAGAPRQNRLP
jgi:hypothetical protein